MPALEPGKLRNVAVVGHRGTGKTSLVEGMLYQAEELNRLGTIDAGTTVGDWDDDEQRRKLSISLSASAACGSGPCVSSIVSIRATLSPPSETVQSSSSAAIDEREKLVVTLYYYEELTLREIGEVLGVTESRVSQLHTKAILRLKARLGGAARTPIS